MTLDLPWTWLEQGFIWVWTTSLSATGLVVIVVVLQLLLRRFLTARWSHALWLCVLLRLIIPTVPSTNFSIFNLSSVVFPEIAPSRSMPVAVGVAIPPTQEPQDPAPEPHSESRAT